MYKKNNNIQKNENNMIKRIINTPNIYSEINNCEYVYMDKINIQDINNPFFKNKILVTRKLNDYFMFENTVSSKMEITKLDYKQVVDLLILNNTTIHQNLTELIDQDTILIKILDNNIYYIEDKRKQVKIIITPYEKIILKNNGINTELTYYEILN